MWRSILFIKLAILSINPHLSDNTVTGYARILQEEAQARSFDPITVVAMVENESRWRASVVGGINNACYGLGQKCAHTVPVCREHGYQSAECKAKMKPFLKGDHALRRVALAITMWRKTCRDITGKSALFKRWLHGYQGYGKLTKNKRWWIRVCGMRPTKRGWVDLPRPRLVKRVMARRLEIIKATERKLSRRKKK